MKSPDHLDQVSVSQPRACETDCRESVLTILYRVSQLSRRNSVWCKRAGFWCNLRTWKHPLSTKCHILKRSKRKTRKHHLPFCQSYGFKLPERYRKRARKEYLAFVGNRKHTTEKVRSALCRQLAYVKRNLQYLEQFMSVRYAMIGKNTNLYLTIIRLRWVATVYVW